MSTSCHHNYFAANLSSPSGVDSPIFFFDHHHSISNLDFSLLISAPQDCQIGFLIPSFLLKRTICNPTSDSILRVSFFFLSRRSLLNSSLYLTYRHNPEQIYFQKSQYFLMFHHMWRPQCSITSHKLTITRASLACG